MGGEVDPTGPDIATSMILAIEAEVGCPDFLGNRQFQVLRPIVTKCGGRLVAGMVHRVRGAVANLIADKGRFSFLPKCEYPHQTVDILIEIFVAPRY